MMMVRSIRTKVSGTRVVSTNQSRATLLGRVTLTYFLKVAQVPRVIDRPISRIPRTDARYQYQSSTKA